MKNILKYKNFIGSVSYSSDDNVFFGKLEGLNDLVTFEGKTVDTLKKAFHEAVEDYLQLCKEAGKDTFKSFKGSFNVRLQPELHRKAALKSIELGMSLNQLVAKALANFVKQKKRRCRRLRGILFSPRLQTGASADSYFMSCIFSFIWFLK